MWLQSPPRQAAGLSASIKDLYSQQQAQPHIAELLIEQQWVAAQPYGRSRAAEPVLSANRNTSTLTSCMLFPVLSEISDSYLSLLRRHARHCPRWTR